MNFMILKGSCFLIKGECAIKLFNLQQFYLSEILVCLNDFYCHVSLALHHEMISLKYYLRYQCLKHLFTN